MATTLPQHPRSTRPSHHVEPNETKGRISVVIPTKPRYEPNGGPPLPRASLLPTHDSTAYIVERILLPPDEVARDGKPKPKRMTYIVGWRDLPAATLLVPAMDILEYVSPRELEDWETALEEELSEDRARLHEEKQIQKVETATSGNPRVKPATGKRKRGRPPAHSNIESAAAAELETDEDAKGRLIGGALSLSTPQKQRMKDFEGLSDEEGSPSRQLEQDLYEAETGRDVATPELEEGDGGALSVGRSASQKHGTSYVQLAGYRHLPPLELQDTGLYSDDIPARIQDPAGSYPTTSCAIAASPTNTQAAKSLSRRPFTNAFKPAGVAPPHVANEELREASLGTSSASPFPELDVPAPKSKNIRRDRAKPKKRKKELEAQQPVKVDGEDQWVIKRIEDDDIFEVEGKSGPVHYYKVRWEGDWPPDQNPSWEPEENLPPNAIRNYKKQGKGRKKPSTSRPNQSHPIAKASKRPGKKQRTLLWEGGKKYSSVSEAFAGAEDISTFDTMQHIEEGMLDSNIRQDDEDDDDELLVVDETQPTGNQTRPSWRAQGNGFFGILGASRA